MTGAILLLLLSDNTQPPINFSYVGSGTIDFHGCPEIEAKYFYNYKFAVGSKVYDRLSAICGYLEPFVVRKAWYVQNKTGLRKVLYKDQHNWLHNEYDICSQSEAITIVTQYYQTKQMNIENLLAELNC